MLRTRFAVLALSLSLAACGTVTGSDPDAGSGPADADPSSTVDADPAAPDAAPPVCTPNTATCADGVLTGCDDAGQYLPAVTCALGCFTDNTRCWDVAPTDGLGAALDVAADRPALVLPDGAIVNTTTGRVRDRLDGDISADSELLAGPPMIRVYKASSITIGDVQVEGDHAVAFVSDGTITIRGALSVAANGSRRGPGSRTANCITGYREWSQALEAGYTEEYGSHFPGGGGGAHATPGATGGINNPGIPGGGGRSHTGNELTGGCFGGGVLAWLDDDSESYEEYGYGGAGGGALHLVSRTSIVLVVANGKTGTINAGGGGGSTKGGGGGAGGRIVLEAPEVALMGAGTAIAANGGGGGGGCEAVGANGTASAVAAAGGSCSATGTSSGGRGATALAAAATGVSLGNGATGSRAGGGGGALGRVVVATRTGQLTMTTGAILSPAPALSVVGQR
jgi:hypothetical protein